MKHEDPYKEAMRYIENARELLSHAGIDGKYYVDVKYVKSACGMAYAGLLKATGFLFDLRGVPKKEGWKSIEYYDEIMSELDENLYKYFRDGYLTLHWMGYKDGCNSIKIIESGFDDALTIIEALKPYSKNGNN